MSRTFDEEARAPFKDSTARSPSLSQPKPTQRVISSSIRQNFRSGDTSALALLQRSTKIGPVAEIQNKCAPVGLPHRVTSSFYLKSILKKK